MNYPKHTIRTKAYQLLLKEMFKLKPETIHHIVFTGIQGLNMLSPVHRFLEKKWAVHDPVLEQELFGVHFPRPLGLAAGFDKNAAAADAWAALGFGYAELGTVTAAPQPGNPAPRLFRLPLDRALLNRMGFNNHGAATAASHLRRRGTKDIIGINIGKTKVVPVEHAADDYRRSAKLVGDLADFLVINVSSPNTPGLRDLQAVESLRPIIKAVQESTSSPILIKIAPDLADDDIDAVADLAVEMGLAGIIATNTTISRQGLQTPGDIVSLMGAGGISGAPLAQRATEVLRRLYARVGHDIVLVGVGGIDSVEEAWRRIGAGASLLQGYTQFIYGGPDWIRDIHLGLASQVRAHGLSNISQAVGKELPWIY